MAFQKGNRLQQSRRGRPNKTTLRCREAIALVADGMATEFEQWLRQTAYGIPKDPTESGPAAEYLVKPDPKGAAEIYLRAIEYHIPKLSRTELKDDRPPAQTFDASALTVEERQQMRRLLMAAIGRTQQSKDENL
jgi:hypothetical protein